MDLLFAQAANMKGEDENGIDENKDSQISNYYDKPKSSDDRLLELWPNSLRNKANFSSILQAQSVPRPCPSDTSIFGAAGVVVIASSPPVHCRGRV